MYDNTAQIDENDKREQNKGRISKLLISQAKLCDTLRTDISK